MKNRYLALTVIAGTVAVATIFAIRPVKPVYVEYWKTGDTLLHDYVCPDTLIVVDAVGLNKAMAYYEQGLIDDEGYTDDAIDSTMHVYCTIK